MSKELLREIRRVSGKTTLLYQLAEAAVAHREGVVRDVLYPVVAEKTLRELVAEYKSQGPGYTLQVQTRLHASYGKHYRRLLPDLLDVLEFRSNNETHRPVIQALELLGRYVTSKKRHVPNLWLPNGIGFKGRLVSSPSVFAGALARSERGSMAVRACGNH